jgi:hypothetical protein
MIELDDLVSVNVDSISAEQIVSNFLDKEKKVLYLGESNDLENILDSTLYKKISQKDINNIENIEEKYDYVVLTEVLETIDDPQSLITKVKNLTESVVIYEYKFDEGCYNNDNWNKPWTKVGLEHFLCKEFDYVNNIFLGYATIYICKYPNNETPSVVG